jgi:hypothetical protein
MKGASTKFPHVFKFEANIQRFDASNRRKLIFCLEGEICPVMMDAAITSCHFGGCEPGAQGTDLLLDTS